MERKIRKQAVLYGVAALLLVALIGTLSYTGIYLPQLPSPAPPSPAPPSALLTTFSSQEAIRDFLASNSGTQGPFPFYGPSDVRLLSPMIEGFNAKTSTEGVTFEHSTTNIQVAGVDEADIVKTDGQYIYVISGNKVSILWAYPPQTARIVSEIALDDMYPVGLFVNGDRLAVIGAKYFIASRSYYNPYNIDIKTFINIYDIHDRTDPVLLRDLVLTGSYFNSRMMGSYIYFVVSQPAYVVYDTVILPKIYSNGQIKEIGPSEIHYSDGSDNYYQYTTFVAMNMQDTSEAPTYLTLMLGGTSSMYVSLVNMYVTFPEMDGKTSIYRVRIEANNTTVQARGNVLGRELNQFSMDEYNNHFRIATATWSNGSPASNLYILNMNLTIVGKLENIEPSETMDAARFIGNRCYLSTSVVRRDPFFVIDVENASDPKILGYLKIPGFTRYLHPYDADHIIGIGKDGNVVKVSLFDVSNVSAPKNMSEYKVEGTWSDTTVLTDHKAFLFDYDKALLAFPVSISSYDQYPHSMWQGLIVFRITLSEGIVQKGTISHHESGINDWDSSYYVKRSLYIENVLYTVSDKKIKLNNLEDLSLIKEILIP